MGDPKAKIQRAIEDARRIGMGRTVEILARAAEALLSKHLQIQDTPWCICEERWPCPILSEIVRER